MRSGILLVKYSLIFILQTVFNIALSYPVQRNTAIAVKSSILVAEYYRAINGVWNMLSYALAIAVGISSLVLFFTAFVLSDLHRQDDFLWSGVGLFYALVLWYCAANITGAVLLGQAAASALIISFSWQNLQLRKAIARPETAKSPLSSKFSWLGSLSRLWQRQKGNPSPAADEANTASTAVDLPKVTEQEITIPDADSPAATETDSSIAKETVTEEQATTKPVTEEETTNVVNTPDTDPQTQPEAESQTESIEESQPETQANEVKEAPESSTAESTEEPLESQTNSEKAVETKSESPESTSPSAPNTDTATPKIKDTESVLDSLETVEVAEVLEADPEDSGSNRDHDRSNIIDVTTTEVDAATPVKNTDSATADNLNQEQQ